MATIKFWSEMTKATTVDGEDKVMIGRNATGEAMYADFQYLINQAGMNSSDYIPVDGNTLPDGGEGNKVTFAAPGTYTQSGGDDVVVPENSLGIIVWDGDEWVLNSVVTLPVPVGVDYIDPEGEDLPKEKAVARWALNKYSERALPEGYEFIELDRPDLTDLSILTLVDEDMRVIPLFPGMDGSLFVTNDYDRPDLELVFIDEEGYILFNLSSNGSSDIDTGEVKSLAKEEIKKSDFISWYTEFGQQDGYNVNPGLSLEDFYDEWDDIIDNKINNPSYPNYVSKELLGISTNNDKEIWRYDFKPPNPQGKVILIGCNHGFEKIPSYMLRRFFDQFIDDWPKHPMLQWARWNLHFIVVPVLNAGGFIPNAYPGNTSTRGVRFVPETDPFPATWTKNGETVTLTFDVADFPDTDGRLDGNEYFSHPGVEGKTFLSVVGSSDTDAIPDNAYRIETVIDGTTVTFNAPAGGATSGSCDILVVVDPNRQYATVTPTWEEYTPNSNLLTGPPPYIQDNKGTRPFSINESIIVRDLLEEEDEGDIALVMDLHAGSGDYTTYYNNASGIDLKPARLAQELTSDFHTGEYTLKSVGHNMISAYASQIHNAPSYTPEWNWYDDMDAENATDIHRWMMNLILILSRYYLKQQ